MYGTILRQSQGTRQDRREHAECFLSIVDHTNAEQRYREWGQLTHFNRTIVQRGPPLTYPAVTCRTFPLCTLEKDENVRLH